MEEPDDEFFDSDSGGEDAPFEQAGVDEQSDEDEDMVSADYIEEDTVREECKKKSYEDVRSGSWTVTSPQGLGYESFHTETSDFTSQIHCGIANHQKANPLSFFKLFFSDEIIRHVPTPSSVC